ERIDANYVCAFRDYGIDVVALDPQVAGALLRARNINVELAAALDDWVYAVLTKTTKTVWQDRLALARAVDADAFRDRVREAVARGDREALKSLTATEEIGNLPTPTLVLVVHVLEGAGTSEPGLALLRKGQRRRPGDFEINFRLAEDL